MTVEKALKLKNDREILLKACGHALIFLGLAEDPQDAAYPTIRLLKSAIRRVTMEAK